MLYKPNKSLGQNFMISDEMANYLVYALNVESTDTVIEIGAGLGAVTQKLSEALFEYGSKIFAVEIDSRFIPKLTEMFRETVNVNLIEADILRWLPEQYFDQDFKVLGSLPYYVTSPILHMLVKLPKQPLRAVLLVQKEVGEKITEQAPNSSYLSTFVQTFFEVEYLKTVPKEVFKPEPKVDGAIITLERLSADPIFSELATVRKYEGFLHKGFSHPRKMLNKAFKKDELAATGINGSLRPQDLGVSVWKDMFAKLVLG